MCTPECENGGNYIIVTDTIDDTMNDTMADHSGSAYYYYDNYDLESEENEASVICDCRNGWEGTMCETREKLVYRYTA